MSTSTSGSTSTKVSSQCARSPSSCIFKGSYEPGERDYAEQEAARLNLAEYERLRRSFGK